jgi:hypothetical protein
MTCRDVERGDVDVSTPPDAAHWALHLRRGIFDNTYSWKGVHDEVGWHDNIEVQVSEEGRNWL